MPDDPTAIHASPPTRAQRIARAERLLDRWLDLYEAAIDRTAAQAVADPDLLPDPTKVGDLANAFTILRRVIEIETLALKHQQLLAATASTQDPHADLADLDPQLFAE